MSKPTARTLGVSARVLDAYREEERQWFITQLTLLAEDNAHAEDGCGKQVIYMDRLYDLLDGL